MLPNMLRYLRLRKPPKVANFVPYKKPLSQHYSVSTIEMPPILRHEFEDTTRKYSPPYRADQLRSVAVRFRFLFDKLPQAADLRDAIREFSSPSETSRVLVIHNTQTTNDPTPVIENRHTVDSPVFPHSSFVATGLASLMGLDFWIPTQQKKTGWPNSECGMPYIFQYTPGDGIRLRPQSPHVDGYDYEQTPIVGSIYCRSNYNNLSTYFIALPAILRELPVGAREMLGSPDFYFQAGDGLASSRFPILSRKNKAGEYTEIRMDCDPGRLHLIKHTNPRALVAVHELVQVIGDLSLPYTSPDNAPLNTKDSSQVSSIPGDIVFWRNRGGVHARGAEKKLQTPGKRELIRMLWSKKDDTTTKQAAVR